MNGNANPRRGWRVFSAKWAAAKTTNPVEADVGKLHTEMGQLLMERGLLAKAFGR